MSTDKDKSSSGETDTDLKSEGHQYMRRGWFLYLNDIEPERPRLFRYCRKLSGNVWDAEDLVQETLLRGERTRVVSVMSAHRHDSGQRRVEQQRKLGD